MQARDWLVGTLDGEFDVDAVTAYPRRDTRNHPIAKPDIGLARARRDHLVHLEGPVGHLGVGLVQ